MKTVGIIGAGASGMIAALYAHKNGCKVTLFEKNDRIGKKILVTGNGRCNFSNANLSKDDYYSEDADFVERILSKYGNRDLCMFFTSLGLLIREKNGFFYPACEQASSVLDVFRFAISETDICVKTETEIVSVNNNNGIYQVIDSNNQKYTFDRLIISSGGKAGLSKKDHVNGYDLVKSLSHKVTKLYPSLTQIKCGGANFKSLAGVRSECGLSVFVDDCELMKQFGEVLFTDYGISGIVSFQVSHLVAESVDNKKKVRIILDLLPGLEKEELKAFISNKYLLHVEQTVEEFFSGISNKKLNLEIIKRSGLRLNSKIKEYSKEQIVQCGLLFKCFDFEALGINDFDKAQVTAGGVPISELNDNLESKLNPGLFITGELTNVDGICGGYNLQWAFSTGAIAGEAASL